MSTVRPTVSHMTREARMVLRGSTVTHEFLRARLTLLIGLTLVVDAVGTVLMYWFEGGAKGSDFDDLGGRAVLGHGAADHGLLPDGEPGDDSPAGCSTSCSRCGRSRSWRRRPARSPRSSTRATSEGNAQPEQP
jgi:nitrogen fixation-related uncharacterized protein